MRVEFKRFDAIVFGVGGHVLPPQIVLPWEIEPVRSKLADVRFTVERCQSPAFDSDEITVIEAGIPGVVGTYIYETIDVTAKLQSLWRRYYYRVKAEGPDVELVYSEVKTWEADPKVYEREIMDRHQLLLEGETGVPCFAIIQRSADAPKCSECWDAVTHRTRVQDCPSCLNTGRQRPYFQPIQMVADFNPDAKLVQIAQFGEIHVGQTDVWWGGYPQLKPRDVILEVLSGRIWRVVNIRPIMPQRTIIQHVARLEAVNPSDVEYRSPVMQIDPALRRSLVAKFEASKKERRF